MVEKKIARTVFDTRYETVDGKIFEDKNDAIRHEVELAKELSPQLLAITLSNMCNQFGESKCNICPLNHSEKGCILSSYEPWEWNIEIL